MDAPTVWLHNRSKPLCNVLPMTTGNRPADGGHLIIEQSEYEDLIKTEPNAKPYIKKLTGSEEYIKGKKRYCLWLVDIDQSEIDKMPEVQKRIEACKEDRLNGAPDRQKLASAPALFRETKNPNNYILVPRVSSEQREYVPLGFLNKDTIPTDSAVIIINAKQFEFGILTSQFHNAWMRVVTGRLKSDYRYSKDIVYNNFIWPGPTCEQQSVIETCAQAVLDIRDKYPEKSLAVLYDPDKMLSDLLAAHKALDQAVEAAYGVDFDGDEEKIIAHLFKLYSDKTANE